MRKKLPILIAVFLAGAFAGGRLGSQPTPPATGSIGLVPSGIAAAAATTDPWSGWPWPTEPVATSRSAGAAPACDRTARMMAAMFAALANQALANSGKGADGLNAAVASDRGAFMRYLAAVGVPAGDPEIEAMLSAVFPGPSELPTMSMDC